jgi:thimet oligopeptidase
MDPDSHAIAAEAYGRRCASDLADAQAQLAELERVHLPPSPATLLEPLNRLWRLIDRSLNTAGLYRNVHPDAGLRARADACEQQLQKLVTNIGMSRPLYEAVRALDVSHEDAATQRWVTHMLRDFRRAGIDKDAAAQSRIRGLKDDLVRIGQTFDKNIRQDVRRIKVPAAALAGLPDDYIAARPADAAGQVELSTDTPDYLPFMSYAHDDAARLSYYTAFRQRGYPANEPVLLDLLRKRHALANLLGYPNWAAYTTEDKMIKTPEAAQNFIDKVSQVASPRAARDYQELLAQLKKQTPAAEEVGDWQKAYLEEQVKKEAYAFDAQAARQYFAFGRVREGLFATTSRLFGVSFAQIDVPVWHPDVKAYEMRDGDAVLGRFYLDLHPRADKYKHAAAFPLRSGIAHTQLPEAALVCNFPAGDSALMEHDEVETFFHEFGHLLHHLFAGQQRWIAQSGIATEWDFVEAPSQMFEEWTYDADTLKSFAVDANGKTLDDTLIKAMRRARDFAKGLQVRHQMFYAAVSLQLHTADPQTLAPAKLMQTLQTRYSPFAYVQGTRFELSFGHLEGYSALYYTYMWSLVISKDLFSAFAAPGHPDGLFNRTLATRYRDLVLAPGGSQDAADLVHHFLQRDFSFDAFDRWMNAD